MRGIGDHDGVAPDDACAKPNIRDFLDRERRARFRRLHIDGDEVLALVSGDARARIADVLDANGNVLPPEKWPESMHNSIEQYEKKADGSVKVKLAPALTGSTRHKLANTRRASPPSSRTCCMLGLTAITN